MRLHAIAENPTGREQDLKEMERARQLVKKEQDELSSDNLSRKNKTTCHPTSKVVFTSEDNLSRMNKTTCQERTRQLVIRQLDKLSLPVGKEQDKLS